MRSRASLTHPALRLALAPLLALVLSCTAGRVAEPGQGVEQPSFSGVVVESAAGGSAGLAAGDRVTSWEIVGECRPAADAPASGAVKTPFDLAGVEEEQAKSCAVLLRGTRQGVAVEVTFPAGAPWKLRTRSSLGTEALRTYEKGRERFAAGDSAEGAVLWRQLIQELGEKDSETACWLAFRLSETLSGAKDGEGALGASDTALQLAREGGDGRVLSAVLKQRAVVLISLGRFAAAFDVLEEARAGVAGRVRGGFGEAVLLNTLGVAKQNLGELSEAQRFFGESAALREKIAPDSLDLSLSYNNLGATAAMQGDAAAAELLFRKSLDIKERKVPGSATLARSLSNLGLLTTSRGDLASAEELFGRAIAILEKVAPAGPVMGESLLNLGMVYWRREELDAAEQTYRRALELYRSADPDGGDVALCLLDLGAVARERGDLEEAEALANRALAIREALAPGGLEMALLYNNLGQIAEDRGDFVAAEAFHRKALSIQLTTAPNSLDVVQSLGALAEVELSLGRPAEAERDGRRALEVVRAVAPGSEAEARILFRLGRTALARGERGRALEFHLQALAAFERQVGRMGGSEESRTRFAAAFSNYYFDTLSLLMELGRPREAFAVLERSRARRMLEILAERDLIFAADVPAELDRERRALSSGLEEARRAVVEAAASGDAATLHERSARVQELASREAALADSLRRASPRYAALAYPVPLDAERTSRAVGAGTLLLSYSVGAEQSFLFAFGPGEGEFHAYRLGIGAALLRMKVLRFRGAIQLGGDVRGPSGELGRLLLGPAAHLLGRAHHLVVCPDGPLHLLPFSALRNPKQKGFHFLAEALPLSLALSATLYSESGGALDPGRERRPTVALADPEFPPFEEAPPELRRFYGPGGSPPALPEARREARYLVEAFPGKTTAWYGRDATAARATSLPRETGVVLFACHAFADERFPLESSLLLAGDPASGASGRLPAWKVFERVRTDADLVVLSACETGIGQQAGGEGLIGLTRAFQYAGARTVLASLWGVSDQSTAELMRRFYGRLKEGIPKAEALRLAQVEMIRSASLSSGEGSAEGAWPPDYSHPFFWAPFVLSGDGR